MLAALRVIHVDHRLRLLYWSGFALGLLWLVSLWLRTTGNLLDDEIGHVVIAHNSWQHPENLLNIWGRVVNTLVYFIPAQFGLLGARLASVIMAMLTVLVTTAVAHQLGVKRLALVPLMLWFQPWFSDLSYGAITEVPFTLFLILGAYWWLAGRYERAALALSALSLIRHEGIVLFGLWVLSMLATKHWRAAIVGWLPILLYNAAYGLVLHVPINALPLAIYFQPTGTTFYGSGSLLHYVPEVVFWVGFAEWLWVWCGIVPAIRRRSQALIFGLYLLYFALHSVIFWLGWYGSGGYGLFLLPLAPGFALLATLGAEQVLGGLLAAARKNSARTRQIVTILWALVVIVPVVFFGLLTRPYRASSLQSALDEAATWLKSYDTIAFDRVYSTHPWFYYFYDLPLTPAKTWYNPPPPNAMPTGGVFVWDDYYSERFGYTYEVLTDPANHWRLLQGFGKPEAVIFQKE